MPWRFKLDNISLPRGNVEEPHGRLCLASKLFATCCGLIFIGNGFCYIYLRQVCKVLGVLGAAECIQLPFRTLYHENLAFLG